MSDAAPSSETVEGAWPTGTLLAQKFRIVRVIGAGGMGIVYEVIHEITRHRRALKTLKATAREHPTAVERFLREASAAGRIGSPHIAETYDAGLLDTGEPYLVMELLEGETLERRLARKARLEPEEIIAVFTQACEGVQAAHDAGIVHRDLKPENLFLAKTRDGMRVKLLDFGVSIFDDRHRLDRATTDGSVLGTPFYMSPEQVRGVKELDGRSDVYALGVMMHECATGEHPYPGETLPVLIANVLEKKPPPLSEAVPGFPASLSALCQRALEKNVDLRLPSARAFGEALGACAIELGVASLTPAPRSQAAAAASWIAALPSRQVAVRSTASAASIVPPPPGASRRRPLLLSLVGAILGAGVVGAGVLMLVGRARPNAPPPAPTRELAPPAASTAPASVDVAPTAASAAPPTASAAPPPPPSAKAAVLAPRAPPAPSPPAAKPPPKATDLAGKGEFKP